MKKLRLKIWVEDENGQIKASQQHAGELPVCFKDPNLIELDWTNDCAEIDYKVLINAVAVLLAAKYPEEYVGYYIDARKHLKKELGI